MPGVLSFASSAFASSAHQATEFQYITSARRHTAVVSGLGDPNIDKHVGVGGYPEVATMSDPLSTFAQLSLDSPSTAIQNLTNFHNGLIEALQQADQLATIPGGASPVALFQRITGCKRTEAMFYLTSNNNDIRSAVIVWHSQVLRDYLATYQKQVPCGLTYKQHEIREAADHMREKARKAAASAQNFESNMAQNYLRTNFCSICKVERDAADVYMAATNYNLIAAVEEFIARHMLSPAETQHPDTGLADQVLVTRCSSWGSENSQSILRDHSAAAAVAAAKTRVSEDGQMSGVLRSRYAAASAAQTH